MSNRRLLRSSLILFNIAYLAVFGLMCFYAFNGVSLMLTSTSGKGLGVWALGPINIVFLLGALGGWLAWLIRAKRHNWEERTIFYEFLVLTSFVFASYCCVFALHWLDSIMINVRQNTNGLSRAISFFIPNLIGMVGFTVLGVFLLIHKIKTGRGKANEKSQLAVAAMFYTGSIVGMGVLAYFGMENFIAHSSQASVSDVVLGPINLVFIVLAVLIEGIWIGMRIKRRGSFDFALASLEQGIIASVAFIQLDLCVSVSYFGQLVAAGNGYRNSLPLISCLLGLIIAFMVCLLMVSLHKRRLGEDASK